MFFVYTCCAIATFLAFLYSKEKNEYGLLLGFILVTVIQAIRFEYGTDMPGYYEQYNQIVSYPFSLQAIYNKLIYKEPVWALLCFAFKYIGGFYSMTFFISVFENVAFYYFIKRNVDREYQYFAVFIYLFTFSFYMLNMSMLRQGLAISIGLIVYECVKDDKYILAVIWAIVASQIHISALMLAFVLIIKFISRLRNEVVVSIIFSVFLLLFLFSEKIPDVTIFLIDNSMLENYELYNFTVNGHMGIGFLICSIPFFCMLFLLLRAPSLRDENIVMLSALGYMLAPFGTQVHLADRMLFYLSVFNIAAVPRVVKFFDNKLIRIVIVVIFVGYILFVSYFNMSADSFKYAYLNYRTIFSEM